MILSPGSGFVCLLHIAESSWSWVNFMASERSTPPKRPLRPLKLCSGEVGPLQLRQHEVGPLELLSPEHGAVEPRLLEGWPALNYPFEHGALELEDHASPGRGADKGGQTCDVTPNCRAAVEVAQQLGLIVDEPVLIQETNNTVVWLRPHAIIAKVGTHADSADGLVREHEVASALAALGAPVGPPLPGASPLRHSATGLVVTLWSRLDHDTDVQAPGPIVGTSLRQVHEALSICDLALPSFRIGLERARAALADDIRVAALDAVDRAFLRTAFDELVAELGDRVLSERPLHGEPHDGNCLLTPGGLRWIDFENACRGPLEWDLAFLPDNALKPFGDVDLELLELLRALNSACVATWCWVQARFPEIRWHGKHHLAVVRAWWLRQAGGRAQRWPS